MFDAVFDLAARQVGALFRETTWPDGQGQTRAVSDPLNQAAHFRNSFGLPTRIAFGRVVDYIATTHCYKVQLDRMHAPVIAFLGTSGSLSVFGARSINLLQPGDAVWVVLNEQGRYGWIVCTVPGYVSDGRRCLLDQLSLTTRARVDSAHRTPLKMNKRHSGIVNRIAGRPYDGVGGDTGWITTTGLRFTIDDDLIQLAVSEMCGLFGFYGDDFLRLAAYNYEHFTAGHVHEHLNDQGELRDYSGWAAYPYEQLGLFAKGDPRRELQPKAFLVDEPHYSNWEPRDDHQQPFHRIQQFRGYLGQGGRITHTLPPKTPPDLLKYDDEQKLIGVAQDFTTLPGHRCIATARGFSLVKRLYNPIPHRMFKPEDGRGDTPENYRFSGSEGSGDEHKVKAGPATQGEKPYLQTAAGLLDLHAYLFNWGGLHPFHYHKKDWYTPNESELDYADKGWEIPDFSKLQSKTHLEPPEPTKVKVDDRYGEVDYYPTYASFDVTPEGNHIYRSGCGCSIEMANGNVTISAPGDIFFKSGRSVITWAGWDAIVRAQNSFDISASKHDGRIAAQQHLHFLGGNDGSNGSILLECRASGSTYDYSQSGEKVRSSGIVLRSKQADVAVIGRNVYARSEQSGNIVIDADKGNGSLVLMGNEIRHHVQSAVVHAYGAEENITSVHRFESNSIVLGGTLHATGPISCDNGLLVRGSVLVSNGHILTQQASSNQFVAPLQDAGLEQVNAYIDQQQSLANNENPQTSRTDYEDVPKAAFYESQKIGNDEVLQQLGFSFRSESEYLTEDWSLVEDHWQQLARLGQSTTAKWEEPGVTTINSGKTYPYPGRDNFEKPKFLQQSLVLYDVKNGRSKDRGAEYEDPKFEALVPATLAAGYTVIKRAE